MLGRTLTFNKQELQKRFTNEHTFYLMAETETDMNRYHIFIIHSLADEDLDDFQFLAIMSRATMKWTSK
ncbi:GRB2-associated-binding protein 2 [Cricetulus griseus]|nr:GRB2-associated-binding protein 2 [Cricetulus griseus]